MPGLATSNPALQKLVFALVFPMGLLMVILSGAQLYTGNTAVVTCALCEGKVRASGHLCVLEGENPNGQGM